MKEMVALKNELYQPHYIGFLKSHLYTSDVALSMEYEGVGYDLYISHGRVGTKCNVCGIKM